MKTMILIFAMALSGCRPAPRPGGTEGTTAPAKVRKVRMEPWEHGWKTTLVVATRYRNETFGQNIGLDRKSVV